MDQRNQIEAVLRLHLNERVIAFHPIYAKILGGIEEAIFFQQICFWSDKGKRDDGAIYKTSKDIEEETTLSDRVQRRVKKKFRSSDCLRFGLRRSEAVLYATTACTGMSCENA